jgi:Transglycosylase SLT domain/Sel1 repeat
MRMNSAIRTMSWRVLLAPVVSMLFMLPPCLAQTQSDSFSTDKILSLRAEARAYEHGEGVTKNPARAIALYCEGARLGDHEAQFSLGWMYANGRGVTRADDIAAFFFAMAADHGHEQARTMLRFVDDANMKVPECFKPKQGGQKTALRSAGSNFEAMAPVEFVAVTPAQKKAAELVQKLAPEYGISPRLALAVIRVESNFNPMARSNKNAQGLMQLIPETALRFNVTTPFDPAQNVRGGLAYLRWLLAYFKGNVSLVAAAYNAGEGAVNRYRGIPPYAETRGYVNRIMQFFGMAEHPYDASVTAPSPALSQIRIHSGPYSTDTR